MHHSQIFETLPIMDDFHLLRCSIQKDYKFPYNISEFSNSTSIEKVTSEPKAMGLCTVLGIFIVFVTDIFFLRYEFNMLSVTSLEANLSKIFNAKTFSRTIVLTFLVFLFPLISIFLLVLLIYRELCSVIIKKKDVRFVSFLDSFDVFWCLEDDTSKSIINVLGVIESDSPFAIADKIKLELEKVTTNEKAKKIFYRRNEAYGFFYWRRYSKIDMNQYVEVVELPQKTKNNVENMENLMSDLQEQPLPYQDRGLFKILITRQRIGNVTDEKGDFGIIIRVHHSVGDGVALIEFLCEMFADKTTDNPTNMFSLPETCNSESPSTLVGMMRTLLEMPICFIDGALRKPDANLLHGPKLKGKKLFKWTESDENLLTLIKEIKNNADELNFSEVLLAALSSGLRRFLEKVPPVPEDVGVILPIRFPKTSDDQNLESNFSVTILNVPVKEDNLVDIKNRCNELRKSADPLVNKYFLELVGRIFPIGILRPLLYSDKATLIFSNMPGPKELTLCGGNALKSMVFFVPHKGTTGLGISSLSYGGVLRFAIEADQALVSGAEDLALILDGIVDEIKRLHRRFVK